ncbi:MAG: hypothetical protein MUC50_18725 [Myxococcota bacterium]|jgi:hypothetical protein|nr:hypothetical protein [Myxococcota bacterium]
MKTLLRVLWGVWALLLFVVPLGCGNETDEGEATSDGSDSGIHDTDTTDGIVIDHTLTDLSEIPSSAIQTAVSGLHIAYNHTSHGSQLITGMGSLATYPAFGSTYAFGSSGLDLRDGAIPGAVQDLSQGDSVDENGDTPWVGQTRDYLDDPANADINVVIWSWCSINEHDAQRYVDNLEKLIAQYPKVTFVFMTGHAEAQGEDTTTHSVHYNNQLIRQHAASHGRVLFDFADIEAYDPDGDYFWDQNMDDALSYTGGNWAQEWIAQHPSHELSLLTMGTDGFGGTSGCAHSVLPQEANLNCVLKGRAAWALFARIAGWNGQ